MSEQLHFKLTSGPWTTALQAIEYGLMGNQEACRAYAELLLQRFEQEYGGEPEHTVRYLKKMLAGETQTQTGKGPTYHLTAKPAE